MRGAVDWNDLRYLLAVERRGSLARAAAELGVTKATASRRLEALEEALGVALVERRPAGLALTAAGARAVAAAADMSNVAAELERDLQQHRSDAPSGVVRLTAPPWLADRLLIPGLPRFRARYPDIELRLLGSHELLDLTARAADLALRNVIPARGPLVCRRVGELAGCVYASALYAQRRGLPASRDELPGHDLLAYEGMRGMPGFEWLVEERWLPQVVFRAGDPVGLVSAVAAGLGLGAVPCLLGETQPHLRRVEGLGIGFSPLYLIAHEESADAARTRVVMQFVVDALRENEAVLLGRGRESDAEPEG